MKIKLNLLPLQRKEEISGAKKLKSIFGFIFEASVILVVFFMLLFSINYILKMNMIFIANNYETPGVKEKYVELEKYGEKVKEINSQVSSVETIQKDQIYWSKLFSRLDEILSEEIILNDLTTKDYTILLTGKSETRDGLVSLEEKLKNESCFSDVKLPLSNLVSKEDVDFQIEFNIKEECIKEN